MRIGSSQRQKRKSVWAFAAVVSVFAALAIVIPAPAQPSSGTAALEIDSGRVDGIVLASGVQAYLGIPYAAPPVRDLRWRDPQPALHWQGIFHADRFGPQCMQPQRGLLTNQYSGAEVTSEDCLYLNVWTKPGLKNAPVIVYIHGGGLFIGASSMPIYNGENLPQKGAVFVSFNYRLGALGFMAHPELSAESPHKTSGNYGFLDQVAVLQWIHRNIAQFGGDPANVTIAGQSAGSMSVLALQTTPLAKGLIHRAVGMSGSTFGPMRNLADGEREGVKFQEVLKAKSIAEMRALPADRLGVPRTPGGPAVGPIQDGYVFPDQIAPVFARSEQSDIPLILGFAHDESFGGFGEIKDLADYRAKAAARFGDRVKEFLKYYSASTDDEARKQARLADRDSTMVSGMNAWARAQVRNGHAPVYTYEFSRAHSYALNVKFTDLDPATAGAYHTSEVPFWLGTLDAFNQFRKTRDWKEADRDVSEAMTESLVAFAKSGNPTTGKMKWLKYDAKKEQLLEIGNSVRASTWPDPRKLKLLEDRPPVAAVPGKMRD